MNLVQKNAKATLTGNWRCRASTLSLLLGSLPLLGCGTSSPAPESDGALHGELHTYRISYPDGHSEREYYLAPDAESPADRRLLFRGEPELEPWTRVRVWGEPSADGFRVARYETEPADDEVASQSAAVLNPTKKSRTVGFVMMDTGNGVNVSSANAQTAIFGARAATQAGLNQFYTENSYGGLSFTGEILGPATITTLGTCQQSAITQIENAWANHFGKTFQHWMTYIGGTYSACGWSGIGGEGTAARPASGSWYNASTGCTVLNQEVGHNLGLMHSNSLRCSGASFIDDLSTCSGAEYGDRHTVMGSGCAHLTAYEKWYEGFFGACNGVRASVSGTYTLLPTEIACDGVQALQIPMPKTRPFRNTQGTTTTVNLSKYYLELRTKTGIDGNEAGPMVLVIVGGEVPVASKTSEFSWVLDMNPSTTNSFDGMSKGQSFTDPAGGVSFTVSELDANHASIDVTIANGSGSPTCIDGTTFAPPGPAQCGTPSSGGSGGSGGSGAGGGASGGKSSNGSGGKASGGSSNAGGTGAGGMSGAARGGSSNTGGGGKSGGGTTGSNGKGGAASGGSSPGGSANGGAASGGQTATVGASGGAGSGGASAGGSGPIAGVPNGGSSNSGGTQAASGGVKASHSGSVGLPGSTDSSGCTCSMEPGAPHRSAWSLVGLMSVGLVLRRRRR